MNVTPIANGVWMANGGGGIILKMNDPTKISNAFPPDKLRLQPFGGSYLVGLPYCQDTMQVLRNLGYNTAGIEPVRHALPLPKVEGRYDLMSHQIITAAFFTDNPRAFCTSTMRTGKTASAITAASFLQDRREAGAFLICATVSNMRGVWVKELAGMCRGKRVVVLYDKDLEKRKRKLNIDADFYITNYDGMKLMCDELCNAVENGRISGLIADELTHFANSRSQLWESANKIINGVRYTEGSPREYTNPETGVVKKFRPRKKFLPNARALKYVWGLTGSPGGPEMIYGQVKLVNPPKMNCLFTQWRDRTMVKIGFKYVPRQGYEAHIAAAMQPCIRFDKDDIMDLPPVTTSGWDAPLTPAQDKLCKAIRNDMVALSESGEKITATTKSAMIFKLLQVAGGVVKIDEERTEDVDCSSRIDELEKIIKQTDKKVVVFAAFTAVIDKLVKELTNRGYETCFVDGRVSDTAREKIFHDFQNTGKYKVGVFHPRTTAFGVELAAADTMVFYGPPLSGEFVYQQAEERLSSLKQQSDHIHIYHMSSTPEERRLFSNIMRGVSVNEAINDLFTVRIAEDE